MIQGREKTITYEYLDCVSRNNGHRVRVVKVQHTEFIWFTEAGDQPLDNEVQLRKADFVAQLEQQLTPLQRHVHVLHLHYQYSNFWGDVIEPLFVVDVSTWVWHPATIVLLGRIQG